VGYETRTRDCDLASRYVTNYANPTRVLAEGIEPPCRRVRAAS
jgi:hypothetical protein